MNGWDDEYERQYEHRQWKAVGYGIAVVVVIALLLLVVLTGCGDSKSDKLENSVRGYTAEILSGDANKAFERVSARCQEREGRHFLTEAWGQVRKSWTGSPGIRQYSASIDGDRAEVTYRFEDPVWDQEKEAWIWENGKWVNDEC